jgi:hypothetical protein
MPLPEQARLTLSKNTMVGARNDRMQQDRDVVLERAINRLPFFIEYDRQLIEPTTLTTIISTVPADINLTTDGLFYIDFEKYETWTDVKFSFTASGFKTLSTGKVTFLGTITDELGAETSVPAFAKFYFNSLSEHHTIVGERRVSGLIPGRYRLQFQYQVSAGAFNIDDNDTIAGSVVELPPIPTF